MHGIVSLTWYGGVQCKQDSVCSHQNQTFVQHESIGAGEWKIQRSGGGGGGRIPPQTVIMLCIQHFYTRRKNKQTMKMPFPYQKDNSWSISDNPYLQGFLVQSKMRKFRNESHSMRTWFKFTAYSVSVHKAPKWRKTITLHSYNSYRPDCWGWHKLLDSYIFLYWNWQHSNIMAQHWELFRIHKNMPNTS